MHLNLTPENAATADYTQTFETAAWWQKCHAQPGTYALAPAKREHWEYGPPMWAATVHYRSGEGYFQSLWCGNPCGKAWDAAERQKQAGQVGTHQVKLTALQLLLDPRVHLDDAEYEAVLVQATADAEKEYDWRQRQLAADVMRNAERPWPCTGKPHVPSFALDQLAKAAAVLERLYGCANSRAQKGYENTQLPRKAA